MNSRTDTPRTRCRDTGRVPNPNPIDPLRDTPPRNGLLTELQRDTYRTAVVAVDVACLLARLNPVDQRTVATIHRRDWIRLADLPDVDTLLELAGRVEELLR